MKDIFIDSEIANKFADPPNQHYKDFVDWLIKYDEKNKQNNAWIVYSNKLYTEYTRGAYHCNKETAIATIIDTMIQQERFTKISAKQISEFQTKHFTKTIWKDLRCKRKGSNDPDHIPVVFLSVRKMALCDDDDLSHDLINFPRFKKDVKVASSPELLPYK